MLQNTPLVARRSDRERRRFDARSSTGVRIRALIRQYADQLGDAANNPTTADAVRRCAELQALAEDARAAAVRTGIFDLVALSRIEGVADRARRALRLDKLPEPAHVPLRERLAAEAEAG